MALAPLALASLASAQNPLGTITNVGTTWATRGLSAASEQNAATLFTRYDSDAYAGYTSSSAPNVRQVVGVSFVLQDNDLSTQDSFNLVVWSGDPANPNYPDVTSGMVSGGLPFAFPVGSGGGAFFANANFATPVTLPATEDVYVGLQFNSAWTIAGGQITDGLSIWECQQQAPTTPQTGQSWDEPGGGAVGLPMPEDTNFSGYYVAATNPATPPTYQTENSMFKIEPVIPGSGGVAGALTNQVTHPESTLTSAAGFQVQVPGAGTACMHSALFPDAATPSVGAGRADDLVQFFRDDTIPVGSPVFFLIDLGQFNPVEIGLDQFVPGSTGVTCLNFSAANLGFVPTAAVTVGTATENRAHLVTQFPATARPLLSGVSWVRQAIAIDVTTNTLHATACTRQRT